MRRISHDLPGVTQRIAQLSEDLEAAVRDVQAYWKDEQGKAFIQRHTTEVGPTINQLISAMTQTIELFDDIAKQVRDPQDS